MQSPQTDGTAVNTARIRELNDAFRRTLRGGRATMTSGVSELPDCVKAEAMMQVARFFGLHRRTTTRTGNTISAASGS